MKKIVLTGPESSGKTTLAEQLAAHFGTVWVPEFSRRYLNELGRPYTADDLLAIAKGQMALEDGMASKATNGLIFMDTSLEVVKVWSEVRFGFCDEKIEQWLTQRPPDLYLLCLPDLPWSPDPQRENPNDRDMLLERYRKELREQNLAFSQVWGIGSARLANTITAVNDFLKP
ncbi:MAG: ATP-binding protein [Saprospiraceae bacterium]|nr:ATP-binding protein [Saprospiraceae bacterium]